MSKTLDDVMAELAAISRSLSNIETMQRMLLRYAKPEEPRCETCRYLGLTTEAESRALHTHPSRS